MSISGMPAVRGRICLTSDMLKLSISESNGDRTMPIAGIYGPEDFGNQAARHPAVHSPRGMAATRAALPMPSLQWTPEVERATAHLYARVADVIPPVEWPF